jgi:hypothetical protein
MAGFTDRIVRAMKLDPKLYEEVEADRNATGQAMAVVVLGSIAAGIGHLGGQMEFTGPIMAILTAILAWAIWAAVTWVLGTRLLQEPQTKADVGELLRTLGFASAPGLIRVFGIVPGLRWLVAIVAGVWTIVAMVIAVRQALDYKSTPRAVVVVLLGAMVYALLMRLLFVLGMHPGMA